MAVGFGISLGYHRLHTHRGFKTSKAFEYFLAVCGTLTLEGGPIFWVATHRQHHQLSDHDGDPHIPRDGGFWAHMGWILFGDTHHNNTELMGKYAPDLGRDQFYRWLNTYHWVPLTTLGLVLLAVGGWSMVLWGIFLRVVVGLHATWLVNSATHMWGIAPLRDPRRLAQQLVGRAPHLRRRLAQQSPRPPGVGAPRPGVVRVRHLLDHAEDLQRGRHGQRPEGREGPRPPNSKKGGVAPAGGVRPRSIVPDGVRPRSLVYTLPGVRPRPSDYTPAARDRGGVRPRSSVYTHPSERPARGQRGLLITTVAAPPVSPGTPASEYVNTSVPVKSLAGV